MNTIQDMGPDLKVGPGPGMLFPVFSSRACELELGILDFDNTEIAENNLAVADLQVTLDDMGPPARVPPSPHTDHAATVLPTYPLPPRP